MLLAEGAPQRDRGPREGHGVLEGRVLQVGARRREVLEVHARRARSLGQVLVQLLRHEGQERRQHARELQEDPMQGPVGVQLVRLVPVGRAPEATAAAADVPVGQVVDELQQRGHHAEELIGLHALVHRGDQALEA